MQHKHNMIKSFIIIVFFVTGCLCKAIPDEVTVSNSPEDQTGTPTEGSSRADDTQELSKEASIEDTEKIANSESPEQFTESISTNSETTELKDIQMSSTGDGKAANSESNEEPSVKTNLDETTSENTDISTKADANDSKGDEVTRTSRNSESTGSAEAKSASVETETGEDASHIHVKEQAKRAPDEADMSTQSASEENTTTSTEKESEVVSIHDSNSVDEESKIRTASPEENKSSSSEIVADNTKSAESIREAAGLIGQGALALVGRPANRRMLNDHSSQNDEVEKHASEAADTRVAPQEETPPSRQQVHSNYLGGSRSSESQYPYSPPESVTLSPNPPSFKDSIMSSGIPIPLLPPQTSLRSGYPDHFQNPHEPKRNQNEPLRPQVHVPLPFNERLKPLLPQLPHRLNDACRDNCLMPPSTSPQTFGYYKPPPPPPPPQHPLKTSRPMTLPLPEHFFPQAQHPVPMPLFKPDCINCNHSPIQNWQPQQTLQKVFPPWPQPSRNTMPDRPFNPFSNNQNIFSTFRQAVPEVLPLSDMFSGTWNTFQGTPFTVSSSVRAHATGFSSF